VNLLKKIIIFLYEKKAIEKSLRRWEGNRTKASEELGITRRTLITKIAEYNLDV
ncbi:MAG: hypothetical protein HUK23_06200, partial [Sphaerochaetaceae bacterium]|nr:hypothetical protein [Sphaerochaetaceae bacterium]